MMYETKELVKQLELYADAITGFATVQLVAFILLMTHGDCFTQNVLDGLWWAAGIGGIVNAMYFTLIWLCHRGENKTLGYKEILTADPIMHMVRAARYTIIGVDCVVTILLPFAIEHGVAQKQFHIYWKC